ncbi:MAG: twin-arginine translocase subunit TatC [SAR324 cluster bacterium]|nr:twin-arginine translocase subunit TatC [SAR324 cluster bacterium]
MSLISHLDELRVRLLRYVMLLFVCLLATYGFRKEIVDIVRAPVEGPLQKYSSPQKAGGNGGLKDSSNGQSQDEQSPGPNYLNGLDCSCLPALENDQLKPAVSAAAATEDVSPEIPLAQTGVKAGLENPTVEPSKVEQLEGLKNQFDEVVRDFRAFYLSMSGRDQEAAMVYQGDGESNSGADANPQGQGFQNSQGQGFQSEVIKLDCTCRAKSEKPKTHMVYIGLPELFFAQMKAAIYAAVFFSFPYLIIEIWGFIGPALYKSEKQVYWWFAICTYIFFTGGSLFGYFVVFPFGFDFFLSLSQPGEIMPSLSIGEYLDFTIKLFLAFGTIFELPLAVFVLSRFGLVTPKLMISQARTSLVVILILSAVLTPPDPFTMMLMALPLMSLYILSIGVSFFAVDRKKAALRAQGIDPEEYS